MQVDSIELFHVAMPLIEPWRTAYGEDAVCESVLVKMTSGGLVAWAETTPLAAPCYSGEWAGGVFAVLQKWLAPAIVGRDVESGAALQQLLAHFKGNPFAKAGLDNAWWVLEALRREQPLHTLLGASRQAVDVGADFGAMDDIGLLIDSVAATLGEGYKRVKLKFRPGWGLEMLRAVREEFRTQTLHIDMNAGYRLDHLELLCRLDDFSLAMLEQPLGHDDLIDHARLAQLIRTPVCLDESVSSVERAQQAIDLGSCRYINIKPGRVGGLTNALAIHDLCREAGVACWVGGMLESGVGARICASLAMLDNFTYPADIFPSRRFYAHDLADQELELTRGPDGAPQVAALDAPGIGVAPNPDRLAAMTVAHARVG